MATPIMWIGLLYAVICLAIQFQEHKQAKGDDCFPYDQHKGNCDQVHFYREKIVLCLLAGNYTQPGQYTAETLLVYFLVEHLHAKETKIGTWVLLGTIIRLAMRMGFHRDPRHSPMISPFQGEMRRRLWCQIALYDHLFSSQVGLPEMITKSACDCEEPRNIWDDDLQEEMTELPIAQPDSILIPVMHITVLNKMISVSSKIFELALTTQTISYSTVIDLDKELQDARAAVPAGLQMCPLPELFNDSPEIMVLRIHIDTRYHYARCILHRRYLMPAYEAAHYAYSRSCCIESAIQLAHYQSILHREMQPNGRLPFFRWAMASTLDHIFLVASTILCVDLYQDLISSQSSGSDKTNSRVKKLQTLETILPLWSKASQQSNGARRVTEAISLVIWRAAQMGIVGSPSNSEREDLRQAQPDNSSDTMHAMSAISGLPLANIDDPVCILQSISSPQYAQVDLQQHTQSV